ncbi:hypothetical protein CHL76_09275 [Marinococcus halophilus]|uniref:Uncharacterized protein n=1 Tax=Marinococcus halophilus TaxID=1371 RepID=A0A510Y4U9_MARHA|nr:hypothetical protein [Marinococcus halophilus]OZT80287.1 hypothetical protein CHL76_09275 [Marinococcus halophilus]GEK58350.1 hypothetical protein MHA01_12550 [Marinococcus halophilus]
MDTYYEHPEYRPFFPNALNASHSIEILDFDGLALLIQMTDEAVESPHRPDADDMLHWLWDIGIDYLENNNPGDRQRMVITEADMENGTLITSYENLLKEFEDNGY